MKLKMLVASAMILALLTGAEGCPREEEKQAATPVTVAPTVAPTPPKMDPTTRTLEIKAWAEPYEGGQILLMITGFATIPKPKNGVPRPAVTSKDPFPFQGAVRTPKYTNLYYFPGVLLTVEVRVIAPPVQVVVGCQIRDQGRTVAYKLAQVKIDNGAGVVECGPYTTFA